MLRLPKSTFLLAALATVALVVPAGVQTTAPSDAEAAKKRCRIVVKKVRGKKKRVRVCTKPKPKPPPTSGRFVDVGGYKLAIECTGAGQPTVVLDAQFGGGRRSDWSVITDPTESLVFGTALDELLGAAGDLRAKPLVVLVHGIAPADGTPEFEEVWNRTQRDVARRSATSLLVRADRSDHDIWHDQPALVAEAIRQDVSAVRNGAQLLACGETPMPQLGGTCLEPSSG